MQQLDAIHMYVDVYIIYTHTNIDYKNSIV